MKAQTDIADRVTICFAGDSGDGMQLTGTQFTNTSALAGNDLATFPDYPAEIRAPAGTRAGVSGFQLQFSSDQIFTAGDAADVLVAMNVAALVTNIKKLKPRGTVIINTDKLSDKDLEKADLTTNPLEDGSLDGYEVIEVELSKLTKEAVKDLGLSTKEADRCKNLFALGMTYWMYGRDHSFTKNWIKGKFKEPYSSANLKALEAGHAYAETMEIFERMVEVKSATLTPGTYRNITGTQALAIGLTTGTNLAEKNLFYGTYPITPATDTLHELAKLKNYNVTTFQAEDEIAGICSAIGASWAGSMGVTGTSGPGLALKGEALGLAVMTELPLVVVDVQRGGPSTGLPTKTEQSDLLMALYGRNGEAPMAIIAAATPADCFEVGIEAVRISLEHMTPVMLLTDGYLANGAEPWRLPDIDSLKPIGNRLTRTPNGEDGESLPYKRDPETLARSWATPGTPGMMHRIGGLEKDELTGNVSYDPENHEKMCELRRDKVARIANHIPEQDVFGSDDGLLVLAWGSTFGAIRQAVIKANNDGKKVGHAHLRYISPFPKNLEALVKRYDKVLIPEMNLGQLSRVIKSEYLIDAISHTKIQGQPFKVAEIESAINDAISNNGQEA